MFWEASLPGLCAQTFPPRKTENSHGFIFLRFVSWKPWPFPYDVIFICARLENKTKQIKRKRKINQKTINLTNYLSQSFVVPPAIADAII